MNGTLLQRFVAAPLPIVIALAIASRANNSRLSDMRSGCNRRFDAMNRRIDEILARLARIERKIDNHEVRIVRLA